MAGISFNIAEDTPIVLRLTLPDNDNSKFIRAYLRDQNGTALTGSPFTLNNLGDGRYFFKDELNLKFPTGALEVNAIYQVYDDSDFLVPTVDYSFQNEDVFRKAEAGTVNVGDIEDAINGLTNMVNKVLTLQPDIEVEVEDVETVEAEIQDDIDSIEAEVEE